MGTQTYIGSIIECDKSFTRADALQKHIRVLHQVTISVAASRGKLGSSSAVATSAPTKAGKKRKNRAASVDSNDRQLDNDDDFAPAQASTISANISAVEGMGEENAPLIFDSESISMIQRYHEREPNLIAYMIKKAKYEYAISEQEGLANDVEVLGLREAELRAENEELLRRIMRKELSFVVLPHSSESTID